MVSNDLTDRRGHFRPKSTITLNSPVQDRFGRGLPSNGSCGHK